MDAVTNSNLPDPVLLNALIAVKSTTRKEVPINSEFRVFDLQPRSFRARRGAAVGLEMDGVESNLPDFVQLQVLDGRSGVCRVR